MNENKLTQVIKTSLNKIPLCFLLTQKQPAKDFSVWSNFSPKNFQLLNCFHTNLSSLGTQAKSYFARPFSPWLHPNFPDTGGISNPCAPHGTLCHPLSHSLLSWHQKPCCACHGSKGRQFLSPSDFFCWVWHGQGLSQTTAVALISASLSEIWTILLISLELQMSSTQSHNSPRNSAQWLGTEVQPALEEAQAVTNHTAKPNGPEERKGCRFSSEEKEFGKFILGNILFHESRDETLLCQKLGSLKAHNSTLMQQLY